MSKPILEKPHNKQLTILLLISVVTIWGVAWPIMKVALDYVAPLYFGALRMFVGAASTFIFVIALGKLAMPSRENIGIILSVSLLQMFIPTALMHFSLLYVEAGRASILAFTHPIWVTPLAILLLKEPSNKGTVGGLVISSLGLLVLFNPLGFDWSNVNVLTGNGLLILAAMSWAVGIVHVRAHKWTSSPLSLLPWQLLLSGICLLGFSLLREGLTTTRWEPELIAIIAFVGIAATSFCYWGAVTVSRNLPAMVSSLGFLGVPVVGIISSSIFLAEPITVTLLAGSTLVLFGLGYLATYGNKSRNT